MNWTNYHNHSQYDDGKFSIEEHVVSAIGQGVKSLGFSGHCPIPFENQWCMKREDLDEYFKDIDNAKAKFKDKGWDRHQFSNIFSPGRVRGLPIDTLF